MKGRKWTAEEQRAIVLEGIKGLKPVAEMCREHQMAQTQYYYSEHRCADRQWRRSAVLSGVSVLRMSTK
jgi:transposase-like protein